MMKKIKALLKSKVGMTFVELLTALALLVIIITSFTPMLLNSYETLYEAGERNEKTYISKTEVEKSLATRDSEAISNFKLEFNSLTSSAKEIYIKMRAALQNIQDNPYVQTGIQTFYYGGNGYIKVVSPSTVPDNEPWKEVVIQFKGIKVNDVVPGGADAAKIITQSGKEDQFVIGVEVVLPSTKDGSAVVSEGELFDASKNALQTGQYDVQIDKDNPKNAIIRIFESVDVVTSIIQINAHYLDENKNPNVATAYVKITPANIMMVGETSKTDQSIEVKDANGNVVHVAQIPNVVYYTSSGVQPVKDDNGLIVGNSFTVFPRTLSTKNTPGAVEFADNENLPFPVGTKFNTVEWISTDTSEYLSPYYVMTGSNGVIQRLFLSNGSASNASAIVGRELSGAPYSDGGLTKMFFPTFWGGDISHQFGYSTFSAGDFDTTTGYYNDSGIESCWYTGNKDTAAGKPEYDIYGVQTKYSMYFNGFGAWCKEEMRNGRRISYILIEAGVPLRLTGTRVDDSDRFGGFLRSWEGASGIDTIKNTNESHWSDTKKVIRVINYNQDNEADNERAFAFLRLIAYGNAPLSELLNDSEDNSQVKYLESAESKNVNVTAAIYNKASGKMMYLGTVPAQGFLQQIDNTSTDGNYAGWFQPETVLWDKKYIPLGGYTGYLIKGSDAGGTTITKLSVNDDRGMLLESLKRSQGIATSGGHSFGTKTFYTDTTDQSLNRATFFVERTYSGTADTSNTFYKMTDSDLEFTLGYSSNREQVFANITYGTDKTEYHNYYERYYNLTHYGDINRSNGTVSGSYDDIPNSYYLTETSNLINQKSNSLYNVWFPGEFYNLTKTATKDGLTVAVGYTVSGSSYQWVNPNQKDSTSTALGSIYNDGVLAIMTDTDESFKNILYYKEDNVQTSDITSNSKIVGNFDDQFGTYGTHARPSVRFTAVDIFKLGEDGTEKSYYAIYGDNHGRVFFSLVAQVNGASHAVADRIGDSAGNYGSLGGLSTVNEFKDTAGKSLSTHFSEITDIAVDGTVIYVTGRGNGANQPPKVAVAKNIPSGDLTFAVIDLVNVPSAENYLINDMLNLGGNVYVAGEVKATGTGFACSVSTDILTHCVDKGYDSLADYVRELGLNNSANDKEINPAAYSQVMPYTDLPTKIYSIAGNVQ